ncbi:glycosyl transferase [Hydrogenovibrio marinus]|uniref:Glycosyl transferase n=1 Tax=Hydrogenovibrio marinus TaxID=28885 RepID=A0A066ZRH8_HYDMR|nr:glycosyl transferase [Hydrogenovibrio marinus]KDN94879.1 glycosyl transferase [Hydrogenovibrio marinus]BBN59344.1 glycosyl transferase [Hydrogenovibrio marinus]
MGDFFQNGTVTTFHNLTDRPVEELERELLNFSQSKPLGIILPSLFSELEGPALKHIVSELKKVPYLSQIVIGLDKANAEQFAFAKEYFAELGNVKIVWNDGPRMQAMTAKLKEQDLAPLERGKGSNVWNCYGYVLASDQVEAVALHDCDVLTYDRSLLARLIYPVAHPTFNFVFSKGYYPRYADGKLNGRASRLLVTPLLRALKGVVGDDALLDYLDSFRYPLAGEFAMDVHCLKEIRIPYDWGLEIGVMSEVLRNYSNRRICQVDIADVYDHKHQNVSFEDKTAGLSRMSQDIAKSLFRKLAVRGHEFSRSTLRTIRAKYYRTALDQLESYAFDAEMNGLRLDLHSEEKVIELFAKNIMDAGVGFIDNPGEMPFMPNWNRVVSACPTILEEIKLAVELDNA